LKQAALIEADRWRRVSRGEPEPSSLSELGDGSLPIHLRGFAYLYFANLATLQKSMKEDRAGSTILF